MFDENDLPSDIDMFTVVNIGYDMRIKLFTDSKQRGDK